MNPRALSHGTDYEGQDPLHWLCSEKLRGVRAYWDGSTLWTRGGFIVNVPGWFTAGLPKFHLDGEVYAGRCEVETVARLAVQNGRWIEGVHTFQVFDAPQFSGTWPARMTTAAALVKDAPHASAIEFAVIRDRREVFAKLQEVQSGGGEGLMLRSPFETSYTPGRTTNLLKVKLSHPAFFTLKFPRTPRRIATRRALHTY